MGQRFAARVRDISEFLVSLPLRNPRGELPRRVAYHDPCHLCHVQNIRSAPRELLQSIRGIKLIPLEESETCCVAAGPYSLTQPEMSRRLAVRKWRHLARTEPDVIATGNVGCVLQLMQHAPPDRAHVPIVHPIELLAHAYENAR
ncbi:MAG: (Fe-S)-binding protein [Phycisphaerae bacterium]